jgi:chromosome segregation ATPase
LVIGTVFLFNKRLAEFRERLAEFNERLAEFRERLAEFNKRLAEFRERLAEFNEPLAEFRESLKVVGMYSASILRHVYDVFFVGVSGTGECLALAV